MESSELTAGRSLPMLVVVIASIFNATTPLLASPLPPLQTAYVLFERYPSRKTRYIVDGLDKPWPGTVRRAPHTGGVWPDLSAVTYSVLRFSRFARRRTRKKHTCVLFCGPVRAQYISEAYTRPVQPWCGYPYPRAPDGIWRWRDSRVRPQRSDELVHSDQNLFGLHEQ